MDRDATVSSNLPIETCRKKVAVAVVALMAVVYCFGFVAAGFGCFDVEMYGSNYHIDFPVVAERTTIPY